MDCRSANILMMKYMDQVLTENEAQSLNLHVLKCECCKEDFILYEQMVDGFEKQSVCLFEPPEDFERRVMAIVYETVPDYGRTYSQDSVVGFVFGAFSIFFGAGVILSMYQAELMAAASKYPYAAEIMDGAAKASAAASVFAGELSSRVLFYFNVFSTLIETVKYGILAIVVALVAAQFIIYSKNKVEA